VVQLIKKGVMIFVLFILLHEKKFPFCRIGNFNVRLLLPKSFSFLFPVANK